MHKIEDVEGIGPVFAEELAKADITTTDQLLEKTATPKLRKDLAETTGLKDKLILKWANRVDLFRIKGVKGQYSDLLEVGGVDTVPELAQRRPDNLHKKLVEVNDEKKLVRKLPTEQQLTEWIDQAKELPRVICY
jgi:predicted flap endonuclease-1-like 5' DNA nuclease